MHMCKISSNRLFPVVFTDHFLSQQLERIKSHFHKQRILGNQGKDCPSPTILGHRTHVFAFGGAYGIGHLSPVVIGYGKATMMSLTNFVNMYKSLCSVELCCGKKSALNWNIMGVLYLLEIMTHI